MIQRWDVKRGPQIIFKTFRLEDRLILGAVGTSVNELVSSQLTSVLIKLHQEQFRHWLSFTLLNTSCLDIGDYLYLKPRKLFSLITCMQAHELLKLKHLPWNEDDIVLPPSCGTWFIWDKFSVFKLSGKCVFILQSSLGSVHVLRQGTMEQIFW